MLCVTDGEEGQTPGRSRAGGPRQAHREAPRGFGPSPEPQLPSLALLSLPGHPILTRASVNPAAASVQPQGMSAGNSTSPPVSQQQAEMSPSAAGMESGAGLALPPCAGSREAERSTKALGLCTAECGLLLLGCLAGSRVGSVPRGTGRIQPYPSPSSQPAQPSLLVQLLEKGLAKFVGADHDGAGGCHLNDAGQEACKQPPGARLGLDAPHE